jgi:hypothetical protein
VQQQHPGAPAAGVVQERGEASPLVASPVQHLADATRCGNPAIRPGRPATDAPTLSEYLHSSALDERTQQHQPDLARTCRRPDHWSPDARR